MLRGLSGALAAICLLLVSACGALDPSPELESRVSEAYRLFRAGDVTAISKMADETLLADLKPEAIEQFRTLIPAADPDSIRLIGYNQVHVVGGQSTHNLTYEYGWAESVALANCFFTQASADAALRLGGFHFQMASRDVLKANDFTLEGKSLQHYLILLGILVTTVLMIAAVVMSLRTPGLRRRWLWVLASLASVSHFAINWATDECKFVLLHGAIMGVVVERADSLFAPWILKTPIPVGAIVVIFRLWRRGKRPEDKAAQDIPPT